MAGMIDPMALLSRFDFPVNTVEPLPERTGGDAVFTVDLEEYFQVSAYQRVSPEHTWRDRESRVRASLEMLLGMLQDAGGKATFFVVGWVAMHHPELVREVCSLGHEVASHGHAHKRVSAVGPVGFRREIRDSKDVIEEASGRVVRGYRAPSFSLTPGHEWAFDILLEEGYEYDSSLFPIRRPGYGHPGALPKPFYINRLGGTILEIPMTTLEFAGMRIPSAGGAYFRHFPYVVTRLALRRNPTGVFYIHPWELDNEQPRLAASRLTWHRHFHGIRSNPEKLRRLLSDFHFTSIERAFALGTQPNRASAGRG